MRNHRCSAATTTKTSQDESELQKSFGLSVSAGGGGSYGGFTGSFKASTDFKTSSKEMNKGENASAHATASCLVAKYALKKITPPCLSGEALKYIQYLAEENDESMWHDFFDNFGTHIITSVEMGDKFVSKTTFNRKEMYKQKAMGLGVSFSAKGGGFGYSASASTSAQTDTSSSQKNT